MGDEVIHIAMTLLEHKNKIGVSEKTWNISSEGREGRMEIIGQGEKESRKRCDLSSEKV